MPAREQPPDDHPGRGHLASHEVALYALAVALGVAGMLLVPRLLNNMIFVMAVLLLVVWLLPAWLRSRR